MLNTYSYSCFNSVLTNVKKSYGKEVTRCAKQTGKGGDDGIIQSRSNLDDEDDDSVSFAINHLNLDDDDLTFDACEFALQARSHLLFSL